MGNQPRKEGTNKKKLRLSVSLADVDNFDGIPLPGNLPLQLSSPHEKGDDTLGRGPRSSSASGAAVPEVALDQEMSLPGSQNSSSSAFPYGSQNSDKPSKSSGGGGGGGRIGGGGLGGCGNTLGNLRDKMVRVVKSLETEQIKNQKRLRFVDDIYEGTNNPDFMSPLARRGKVDAERGGGGEGGGQSGHQEPADLRARREASERAMMGAAPEPSQGEPEGGAVDARGAHGGTEGGREGGGGTRGQLSQGLDAAATSRGHATGGARGDHGHDGGDGDGADGGDGGDGDRDGGGGGDVGVSSTPPPGTVPHSHQDAKMIIPTSPDRAGGGKLGSAVAKYVDDAPGPHFASAVGSKVLSASKKSSRAALDDDMDDVWLEAVRLTRLRIWTFLDDPDSSRWAYLASCAILFLIILSSVTFCLETMHDFENDPSRVYIFSVIECVCIAAFTAEYVLKLLCAPKMVPFALSPLNMVDLISILPFYLEQAVSGGGLSGTRIFRTIRLVRVFRVLKLGGRFGKIQVVATSMAESIDMLAMMMFLLGLTIVIFSTLIFFTERGVYDEDAGIWSRKTDISCDASALEGAGVLLADGKTLVVGCERTETPFKSIPDSFWWTIVTLMTVGYGEEVPISGTGKLVACCAMLVSVLLLALPVSVIGTEFTQQWMEYKKHDGAVESKRKLAPKFVELRDQLKGHLTMLDETLRKMRDTQTAIEDRSMRVRQMLHQKIKEQQALKRKALIKGKQAVAALLDNKLGSDDADEKKFQVEVEELIEDRERLRLCAQTADMMQGEDFPEMVEECVEKYVFMVRAMASIP